MVREAADCATHTSDATTSTNGLLVDAFVSGDQHARLVLYDTVCALAHGEWKRMRGHVGTVVDPDDIAHEAWIRLRGALDGYDTARDLSHFLFGVVRNTARQMAKRERRQNGQDLAATPMACSDGHASEVPSPADLFGSRPDLLVNFVRSVILPRLQARQRPVAILYYLARTSPLLIAEALHRTPRSVHEALVRIEQRLREDALAFLCDRIPSDAFAVLRELLRSENRTVGARVSSRLRRVCAAALEREFGHAPEYPTPVRPQGEPAARR
jgi:RNA polymerase sigma factor (sigma-70 family)